MILMDFSQIMIGTLMVQIGNHQNLEVDVGMVRHMVLNSIRSNKVKFSKDYGELVICADDKKYWRRDIYPYYKASRKKSREKSELDWKSIFDALNLIREELKENFPYKVLQVDGAEADDIIGTLVHEYGTPLNSGEPILVMSGDKDYVQLQRYANVSQWNPTRKKWVKHDNPDEYLFEHIAKGDVGDGVPNVMSKDDCLVMGVRQKMLTKKRLEALRDLDSVDAEVKRNWYRNEQLIDLTKTPADIKAKIIEAYKETPIAERSGLFDYFKDHRLKMLMQNINDF